MGWPKRPFAFDNDWTLEEWRHQQDKLVEAMNAPDAYDPEYKKPKATGPPSMMSDDEMGFWHAMWAAWHAGED